MRLWYIVPKQSFKNVKVIFVSFQHVYLQTIQQYIKMTYQKQNLSYFCFLESISENFPGKRLQFKFVAFSWK